MTYVPPTYVMHDPADPSTAYDPTRCYVTANGVGVSYAESWTADSSSAATLLRTLAAPPAGVVLPCELNVTSAGLPFRRILTAEFPTKEEAQRWAYEHGYLQKSDRSR